MIRGWAAAVWASGALALWSAPAHAEPAMDVALTYTGDVAASVAGGSDESVRYLDNIDLTATGDMDALVGWEGARFQLYVIGNFGRRPNDSAGTLEGVNNIEVGKQGLRLFEAWIEQDLGPSTLRAGLYDLNSEFYANEAAGLLISPPFGIGSELATTGPNGPSIFPSSALAVRLNVPVSDSGDYLRAAVLNARASTLGDDAGIDVSFDQGVLLIGEAGRESEGLKLAAGGWAYSQKRDDIFHIDAVGEPLRQSAWGGYGLAEVRLLPRGEGGLDAFARAGFSHGHTTPFVWGGQAGLLLFPALESRPGSAASIGVHYAQTSSAFEDSLRVAGVRPAGSEWAVEATYADKLAPFLTVQPDVQLVFNPGGRADAPVAVVTTLRVTVELP